MIAREGRDSFNSTRFNYFDVLQNKLAPLANKLDKPVRP